MPSRPQHSNESALVASILDRLKLRRVVAWRNNSGLMRGEYKGKAWAVKLGPTGSPDILGIVPGSGVLFGFEAKVGKNKQTLEQAAWQAAAEASGAKYRVVRSVDQAISALDEWSTAQQCASGAARSTAEQAKGGA
jgi:hypothetical protein